MSNQTGSRWQPVSGVIVEGHGVASGRGGDSRFPQGTLALQTPLFEKHGIDLDDYFQGTLNVSIEPYRPVIRQPRKTLRSIKWSPHLPPEDFSFFDCQLIHEQTARDGLIYYPHPDTKPDHEQPPHVLEVLAPFVKGVKSGEAVTLRLRPSQMGVRIV
jgi:hypothetical protein